MVMPPTAASPVISNWHTLYEGFSTSTHEFYEAVEEAVWARKLPDIQISRVLWSEGGAGSAKREYLRVQRNRIAFDICSAPYGNGHFFSWWLTRIPPRSGILSALGIFFVATGFTWILDLMFSPVLPDGLIVGTLAHAVFPLFLYPLALLVMGYLVQEGMVADEEWVLSLPIIGRLYAFVFNPLTYYRLDIAMMFRDSIRAAVDEVIGELRKEKGLRLLGDEELAPDLPEESARARA